MSQTYKSLLLTKGYDEKVRQGYPWVFTGNLISSVKEIAPGELVELKDHKGKFVARGYCHPKTNLSIRVLSRDAGEKDLLTKEFFLRRLKASWEERKKHPWNPPSFRWVFSDSDRLPGLVLDLFAIEGGEVLLVSQVSTLGMQNAVGELEAALHEWADAEWPQKWSWIEANVSAARRLEGLMVEKPVWRYGKVRDWNQVPVRFKNQEEEMTLLVDFLDGQKTGFFLDQQWNVQNFLTQLKSAPLGESVQVLDLFCYVGQWGTHLAKFLKDLGKKAEVDFVDVSAKALNLAQKSAQSYTDKVQTFEIDIMRDEWAFSQVEYDIVICDPPAFVKKREDLRNAEGAYVGLFAEAMKQLKPGGFIVLSSCSGLVNRDLFTRLVDKAQKQAGEFTWTWKKYGHGPDHPVRPQFPEAEYLKCWIGQKQS